MNRRTILLVCAWILWSQWVGTERDAWSSFGAFKTVEECQATLLKVVRPGQERMNFQCLPDTINPLAGATGSK